MNRPRCESIGGFFCAEILTVLYSFSLSHKGGNIVRRFTVLCFLSVFMCVIFAPRAWADVAINETNFPDATFRSYVKDNCDTDYNGNLSDEEIAAKTDITVGGGSSNLKGIEYFTALTMLNCENNQLTELDVSNNSALQTLYCDNNQLTALNVSKNAKLTYLSCDNNQLTALDVSSSTALKDLTCYSNQLTALDVSKNANLTYLSCHNNELTELDVSNNSNLSNLECYSNQLTALDVSSSTALKYLTCYSNQLTALDVSKNTALTELRCQNNQLTALDVSKNSALQTLYCSNNKLTALNVSSSTALNDLQCYRNQLTALNVSNNANLTYLYCHYNQLTALDVSKNTALQQLYCSNNKLTALDVSNNSALQTLYCSSNQLTALDVSKNSNLSNLECNGQNTSGSNIIYTGDTSSPYKIDFSGYISTGNFTKISSFTAKDSNDAEITTTYANGVAQFASLPSTVTYNYATGKTAMDVTMSDFSLAVGINATIFPDEAFRAYVSGNLDTNKDGYLSEEERTEETFLDVSGQRISSLKGIELFTGLKTLYCNDNQLTELDVSNNTALTRLNCNNNKIATLDVSNNTALTYLNCANNQLAGLDISNCTSLAPDYLTADSNIIITHGTRDGLPSFGKHSLLLSGQLGLDFYAKIPASTNTDGAYADFTVNSKTGSPEMLSNADKVGDDYRFTYYINSVQMADTITAKLCYSDDKKNMAAVQDYRVTDYLDAIISSTDIQAKSPDLVALAKAIKDYGHYVQIPLARYNSWDIGTDHAEIECANQNIDSDSADVKMKLENYKHSKNIDGSGIESLMFDLELESETTLNIYLTPGNDAGNVSAYITDDDNEFDGKTNMAAYKPSENAYVVTISGIPAHKLGKVYTVSITTGKGSGFTVKMSALSYANAIMQSENDGGNIDDDLKRAVISLYKYYIATMKYRDPTFTE